MNAINEHIACISFHGCHRLYLHVRFVARRCEQMRKWTSIANPCVEREYTWHMKKNCQTPPKWIASLYSAANYNIAVRTLNLLCTLQLLAPIKIKKRRRANDRKMNGAATVKPKMFLCYRVFGISLFQWKLIVFKMLFSDLRSAFPFLCVCIL